MDPRPGPSDRPPRNRELERMLVDVVCATAIGAPERAQAWQVYADWLLSLGEPVGEWLAVSVGADDASDAAAPIRAQLDRFERACSFRLVDLALADLSEVPELARIADLTWERGFITSARIRTRAFRGFDSELLEHTPDRLIDVILASPSACVLHELRIDAWTFTAVGTGHRDVAALLGSPGDPLSLRSLELGDGADSLVARERMFARVPELARLRVVSDELGRRAESLDDALAHMLAPAWLPRLRELDLRLRGGADRAVSQLADSPLLERLETLRIDHVGERGGEQILAAGDRFARPARVVLRHAELSPSLATALEQLGCRVAGP